MDRYGFTKEDYDELMDSFETAMGVNKNDK